VELLEQEVLLLLEVVVPQIILLEALVLQILVVVEDQVDIIHLADHMALVAMVVLVL
jgi:hypothetical protein